jgi:hypothetical protein
MDNAIPSMDQILVTTFKYTAMFLLVQMSEHATSFINNWNYLSICNSSIVEM